jgi:drug/metabolite transporter (DMT)-like permease
MRPVTVLKVLATVALWGASFVATKVALRELSPPALIVGRFGLGLAFLLALLAWRRQAALADRRDLPWLAVLGVIGVTVHQLLQSVGLLTTTAGNSGWMVALIPVFTAILARLLLGEPFGSRKVLGLIVASFGALVVVARGLDFRAALSHPVPGDGLVLLSAANMALFTTLSKRVIARYPPVVTMAHVMAFGWLASLPLLAWDNGPQALPALSTWGWWSLVFLGVGCSGVAYAFYYDALAEMDASALSSFQYFQPLVTLVVAAAVLGEPVTAAILGGGAAILAGVWLINRKAP